MHAFLLYQHAKSSIPFLTLMMRVWGGEIDRGRRLGWEGAWSGIQRYDNWDPVKA